MRTYGKETRTLFETAIGWLGPWACSRSFGLGTRVPWDKDFLIESLSDSTLYMAYYTVAVGLTVFSVSHNSIVLIIHIIDAGGFDGTVLAPLGIRAKQLTNSVWDFIFLKYVPHPLFISNNKININKNKLIYKKNIKEMIANLIQG
jgi:leucyl-tRNA synthetase